jgi:two-component system LytT family response regulator
MKYKCLLAEDNTLDRDNLEMLLQKMGLLEIVASCANGMEAAQELMKTPVDIVFSDIDMPELSGMGLLKSLTKPPVFIFISSYKDYAAESFELDVVDFIVKPVMPGRLLRAVKKAIEHIETQKILQKEAAKPPAEQEEDFFIRTSDGLIKLQVQEVAYMESIGNFSKIHTVAADRFFITLVSLKSLEQQLPPNRFMRAHKQYIVNKDNVTAIRNDMLALKGPYELPLSPLYRNAVIDAIAKNKIIERQPGKTGGQ